MDLSFTDLSKQRLVQAGVALVCLILGWSLAIAPVLRKIKTYREAVQDFKTRSELVSEIQGLRKQQEKLEEVLLREKDRHSLLGKVSMLTKESGLQVLSVEPVEDAGESYTRMAMNLDAEGRFSAIVKFLDKIEAMKPAMLTTHLTIGEVSRRSLQQIPRGGVEARILLEGYMKKGN